MWVFLIVNDHYGRILLIQPYQQRGPPGSQLQTFFMPCTGTRGSGRAGTRVTVLSPARVTRVVTGTEEPEPGSGRAGLIRGSDSQIMPRGSQLHRLFTFLNVLFVCCCCSCCCRCCCGVMMLLECGHWTESSWVDGVTLLSPRD